MRISKSIYQHSRRNYKFHAQKQHSHMNPSRAIKAVLIAAGTVVSTVLFTGFGIEYFKKPPLEKQTKEELLESRKANQKKLKRLKSFYDGYIGLTNEQKTIDSLLELHGIPVEPKNKNTSEIKKIN